MLCNTEAPGRRNYPDRHLVEAGHWGSLLVQTAKPDSRNARVFDEDVLHT